MEINVFDGFVSKICLKRFRGVDIVNPIESLNDKMELIEDIVDGISLYKNNEYVQPRVELLYDTNLYFVMTKPSILVQERVYVALYRK